MRLSVHPLERGATALAVRIQRSTRRHVHTHLLLVFRRFQGRRQLRRLALLLALLRTHHVPHAVPHYG